MQIRKLGAVQAAALCGCGLFPHERGHRRVCGCWHMQEVARLRFRIAALEARIATLRPACPGWLADDDRPWRCAMCDRDIFARSARDPDRCIRCAARRLT